MVPTVKYSFIHSLLTLTVFENSFFIWNSKGQKGKVIAKTLQEQATAVYLLLTARSFCPYGKPHVQNATQGKEPASARRTSNPICIY